MAMKAGSELPPGVLVAIEEQPGKTLIYYAKQNGKMASQPRGLISIIKQPSKLWEVGQSHASHGWGPLLYEVAIEYATTNGLGLRPDEMGTSEDAAVVWSKFSQRRDVKATPLGGHSDYLNCSYTKSPARTRELEIAGLLLIDPTSRSK